MHPTIALVLVTLLVSLITFYRWWQPVEGGLLGRFVKHLWQAELGALAVWLVSLLMGWGPVRQLDSILAGLGVLVTVGLALGFVSALLLYFEEARAVLALALPANRRRARRPRPNYYPTSRQWNSAPTRDEAIALPLPAKTNRLDWCPECARWHSAQSHHEHSNLAN
jgi:hypothetical protein